MKYAFVGREKGVLRIIATRQHGEAAQDAKVTLTVEDDGIGLPESIDIANSSSFGLILVRTLAAQLQGEIRIERGKGTRFVLEFGIPLRP